MLFIRELYTSYPLTKKQKTCRDQACRDAPLGTSAATKVIYCYLVICRHRLMRMWLSRIPTLGFFIFCVGVFA